MTVRHTEKYKNDTVRCWKKYLNIGIVKRVNHQGIGKTDLLTDERYMM